MIPIGPECVLSILLDDTLFYQLIFYKRIFFVTNILQIHYIWQDPMLLEEVEEYVG
jgi:hypothetical protein